jgi:two-component system response regulator (stage 0 sporulation protein F)
MRPPFSILVVEHDPNMRSMIGLLLNSAGHTVLESEDGVAASAILERERIDLVITDVVMPKKDGLEFIREVRQQWPTVPIIAVSGGGDHLDGNYCLKVARSMGAAATLDKPFDERKLLQVIADLAAGR